MVEPGSATFSVGLQHKDRVGDRRLNIGKKQSV